MKKRELKTIKEQFNDLLGSLSIEEIMSNPPLMEQIKILAGLLSVLAS